LGTTTIGNIPSIIGTVCTGITGWLGDVYKSNIARKLKGVSIFRIMFKLRSICIGCVTAGLGSIYLVSTTGFTLPQMGWPTLSWPGYSTLGQSDRFVQQVLLISKQRVSVPTMDYITKLGLMLYSCVAETEVVVPSLSFIFCNTC
jgi:uncharacterized membrane protein